MIFITVCLRTVDTSQVYVELRLMSHTSALRLVCVPIAALPTVIPVVQIVYDVLSNLGAKTSDDTTEGVGLAAPTLQKRLNNHLT